MPFRTPLLDRVALVMLLVLPSLGFLVLDDDRSPPLLFHQTPHAPIRAGRRRPPPEEPSHPAEPAQPDEVFASLYDEHREHLRSYLSRLGVPAPILDDLVQETFTRAWAARAQVREHAALVSWLFRIAQRCWFDWLRRRQIEARVLAQVLRERCPSGDEGWSVDHMLLEHALTLLREADREILYLRWHAELGFDEIADLLAISPQAAQRRAHRALERLRRALAQLERAGDSSRDSASS